MRCGEASTPLTRMAAAPVSSDAVPRTVITGGAFEYTFSYLGAAVLHERSGPLVAVSSWHLADGFRVSLGTARSALGMLGEELVAFRDGVEFDRIGPDRLRFLGMISRYSALVGDISLTENTN